MYKCKFCEKSFEKFESLGGHSSVCKLNPNSSFTRQKMNLTHTKKRIKIKIICEKCKKEFEQIVKQNGKEHRNRFCSRNCANGHPHTNKWKQNISNGVKNSPKFINCFKNRKTDIKYVYCVICKNPMVLKNTRIKKTCSDDCYRKLLSSNAKKQGFGGYTPGSIGCNKYKKNCGWYKGYWCDSSWELAFVIYNLEHNIQFERNFDRFYYEYNNKKHYYVPDFKKEGVHIEIKGYEDDVDFIKYKSVENIIILREKEMIQYIEYVKNKYGKDFIKLYDARLDI